MACLATSHAKSSSSITLILLLYHLLIFSLTLVSVHPICLWLQLLWACVQISTSISALLLFFVLIYYDVSFLPAGPCPTHTWYYENVYQAKFFYDSVIIFYWCWPSFPTYLKWSSIFTCFDVFSLCYWTKQWIYASMVWLVLLISITCQSRSVIFSSLMWLNSKTNSWPLISNSLTQCVTSSTQTLAHPNNLLKMLKLVYFSTSGYSW